MKLCYHPICWTAALLVQLTAQHVHAVPSNDACETAQDIASLPFAVDLNLNDLGATNDPPTIPPCSTNGLEKSVWYTFEGTGNVVRVRACHSVFSTFPNFNVYSGDCGNLQCESFNSPEPEDNLTCPYWSHKPTTLRICTTLGETYYVRAGLNSGSAASYTLEVIPDSGFCSLPGIVAPDVVTQIRRLRGRGDVLGCHLDPEIPTPQIDFHWQGLARHPDPTTNVLYATLPWPCSDPGYEGGAVLAIMEIASADVRNGWRLRSNRLNPNLTVGLTTPKPYDRFVGMLRFPDYFHPSGIQTAGHFLAISASGDEHSCSDHSFTDLYDISDPYNPTFFSRLSFGGAGMVGFTQRSNGRQVMVADASWLTFWQTGTSAATWAEYSWSKEQLIDADPDHDAVWPVSGEGTYEAQSLNLVEGTDYPGTPQVESLYLLSLRNTDPAGVGVDRVTIYGVDLPEHGRDASVWQITWQDFPADTAGNMVAGSSVWVAPDGELILYKTGLYNTGPEATFAFVEHSSYRGNVDGTAPGSVCNGHVQLYTSTLLADDSATEASWGVDSMDYLYEDYRSLVLVNPAMNDSISSVAWTLPIGCTCRLYGGFNHTGNYLDLVGNGYTQNYASLAGVPWTSGGGNANNAISSLEFLGDCPGRGYHTAAGQFETNVAPYVTLIQPSNSCTVLKMNTGDYPVNGAVSLWHPMTLQAVGGPVVLGGP